PPPRPGPGRAGPEPPAPPGGVEAGGGQEGPALLPRLVEVSPLAGLRAGPDGRLRRGVPTDPGEGVRRLRLRDERLGLRVAVRPDRPPADVLVRRLHEGTGPPA